MKLCALLAAFAATLSAQAPAAPVIAPDTVVAMVGDRSVTAGEVRKILQDAGPQFAQAYRANPVNAIRDYFAVSYLAGEGEKLKVGDQSPWKEQLEVARAQILASAMVSHERDTFGVSAEDIESYFQRNQARFEQAKIKVISIAFKPPIPSGTSPEAVKAAAEAAMAAAHAQHTEEEARTIAADVVKQARAGADFVALVEKYSDDQISKGAKGDFGVITPTSSYPNDVKKVVFGLKPGEVSDPVRQPTAFYIIRCEERSAQPIGQVREGIVQELRQAHLGDFIRELQTRFTPKIEKPEFFAQPSAAPPTPGVAPARPMPMPGSGPVAPARQ